MPTVRDAMDNSHQDHPSNTVARINDRYRDAVMTEDDWEFANLANAMYSTPNSIEAKLRSIWKAAEDLVRKSETARQTTLTKGWQVKLLRVLDTSALDQKAALVAMLDKPAKPTVLAVAYFDVLRAAGAIRSKLDFITNGSSDGRDLSTIDQIARKDFLHSPKAVDQIIVLFFPLQLHCYHLVEILNSAAGTQAGIVQRSNRAGAGGKVSNHGKEKLWSLYIAFFDSLSADVKFRTVHKLLVAFHDPLVKILTDFQQGAVKDVEGRPYGYAAGMLPENLPNYLKNWAKKYPELKTSMDRFLN